MTFCINTCRNVSFVILTIIVLHYCSVYTQCNNYSNWCVQIYNYCWITKSSVNYVILPTLAICLSKSSNLYRCIKPHYSYAFYMAGDVYIQMVNCKSINVALKILETICPVVLQLQTAPYSHSSSTKACRQDLVVIRSHKIQHKCILQMSSTILQHTYCISHYNTWI